MDTSQPSSSQKHFNEQSKWDKVLNYLANFHTLCRTYAICGHCVGHMPYVDILFVLINYCTLFYSLAFHDFVDVKLCCTYVTIMTGIFER